MKEKNKNQKGFILFELFWRVALFLIIFLGIPAIFIALIEGDIKTSLIVLAFLVIVGFPTYWFGKKLIKELKKP